MSRIGRVLVVLLALSFVVALALAAGGCKKKTEEGAAAGSTAQPAAQKTPGKNAEPPSGAAPAGSEKAPVRTK